jgi:3-deoxy-D-manno-octulosonic-acid transferase
LFIYRTLLTLLAPALCIALLWRLLRGKETLAGLKQRLGYVAKFDGPIIWVHGASVGELTAARSLVEQLLHADAETQVHVTANTYTGVDYALSWKNPRVTASLAPLDYGWAARRFLARISPGKMISLENEIWPNRFRICAENAIPIVVAAGRISSSAFATWTRLGGLAKATMQSITLLSSGDANSSERFTALGLPKSAQREVLNLKAFVALPQPDAAKIAAIHKWSPRSNVFLAASTHSGEDQIILKAFQLARQHTPDLRLIIAPRHPDRVPEIVHLLKQAGLKFSRHTEATPPNDIGDVLIADGLGDMALWYSVSFAAFVGGSLVEKGGHTPFEPAQFNCAIIHGPSTYNQSAAYEALQTANAATQVNDGAALANAISASHKLFLRDGPSTHPQSALGTVQGGDALAGFVREITDV